MTGAHAAVMIVIYCIATFGFISIASLICV